MIKSYFDSLQFFLTVIGFLFTLLGFKNDILWLSIVSFTVIILSLLSYFLVKYLSGRKSKRTFTKPSKSSRSYIRGLLPFEYGENLLGRDKDSKQILSKLTSADYKFGYISGDAGSGKTSLIRASVLPGLAELSYGVIYVTKFNNDLVKTCLKSIDTKYNSEGLNQNNLTLSELLLKFTSINNFKKLILIIDQFEDFFIVNNTFAKRSAFINEIGECFLKLENRFGLFLSIRKEFVDDLHDFVSVVSQPLDSRYSYRLKNWEPDEALIILNAIVEHDQIPFDSLLIKSIISDLSVSGELRPVEMQLVVTKLNELNVFDIDKFRKIDRTKGVLTSYIKDLISPEKEKTQELEFQVTRHLLRLLCSGKSNSKRPVGLNFNELSNLLTETFKLKGLSYLFNDSSKFENVLRGVLKKCMDSYTIILEDEEKYNLVHDYIVPAILAATSDIETSEESANRLLDQYLETQRQNKRTIIPYKVLKFISNNIPNSRRIESETTKLLKRSKLFFYYKLTFIIVSVLLALQISVPSRIDLSIETYNIQHNKWLYGKDKKVFISFKQNEKSIVWNSELPWKDKINVDFDLTDILVSPKSNYLCGISKNGDCFVWP